jgi:undecaprenyl-diphosphatase
MDWHVFHWVNVFALHHDGVEDTGTFVETWGVTMFAVATFALWLLDRPRGRLHWRLTSASALASAGMALLVNQLVAKVYDRPRPYQTHQDVHVFVPRSHDPSFPSDHASAAFGIAFAVLMFDRLAGALFVAAAALIGVGRVLVGVHYPGDVLAGMLVGLACAVVAVRLARPLLGSLVRLAERVTDPLVAPLWRRLPSR